MVGYGLTQATASTHHTHTHTHTCTLHVRGTTHQVTTTTPHGFTAGDAIILDVGSQLNSDWNKLGHQVLMVGSVTHSMAFTVVNT